MNAQTKLVGTIVFVGSLFLCAGIEAIVYAEKRELWVAVGEAGIAIGVSILSLGILNIYEKEFEISRRLAMRGKPKIDFGEFIADIKKCHGRILICTTWTPLLTSQVWETDIFSEFLTALETVNTAGKEMEIRLMLVDPTSMGGIYRCKQLPNGRLEEAAIENYDNALKLIKKFQGSNVAIRIRYFSVLPPCSYYQIDDVLNLGFFWYNKEAARSQRFTCRLGSEPGQIWHNVIEEMWAETGAYRIKDISEMTEIMAAFKAENARKN